MQMWSGVFASRGVSVLPRSIGAEWIQLKWSGVILPRLFGAVALEQRRVDNATVTGHRDPPAISRVSRVVAAALLSMLVHVAPLSAAVQMTTISGTIVDDTGTPIAYA